MTTPTTGTGPWVPRDELLQHVDLEALADDVLGPRHGAGRSACWPCPSPGHGPQTGRTPPVSIYATASGIPRWRCHACGAGGTAIDLLMEAKGLSVADAFRALGAQTPRSPSPAHQPTRLPAARSTHATAWARHALNVYVDACEARLASDTGEPARAWLAARGLREPVLQANRVGYDPGPRHLTRAKGLPHRGPGIVFPVLDAHGPIYVQTRALDPDTTGRKYDNPASWLAPNPRHATICSPDTTTQDTPRRRTGECVFICEGIPDALSISQAGGNAVALLGAGLADQRTATWLHERHPQARLVLAFDNDPRGLTATRELAGRLEDLGHQTISELVLPNGIGDINLLLTHDEHALRNAIQREIDTIGPLDLDAIHEVPVVEL